MGTRGHLGGIAEATLQAALVLDAAGKDLLFLETVGTGQSEVEIVTIADTILLVLMPGSGDSIQALKAGIMEIPDVIAVNKRDHPAAQTMVNEVRSVLSLDTEQEWQPPIVLTEATRGEGVGSSGRPSRSTAPTSASKAGWSAAGRPTSRRRCSRSRRRGRALGWRTLSRPTRSSASSSSACKRRELDPLAAVREIMERVFGINGDEDSTDAR